MGSRTSAIASDITRLKEPAITDILIRDFPPDDLARLDARASALGLSRTEFIRRQLSQEARRVTGTVSADDLRRLAEVFADLADPEVMADAWR